MIRERLALIKEAVNILSKTKVFSEYREVNQFNVVAKFWQINGVNSNGSQIKVIVRKIGNGLSHFFSVMKD